MKKLSLLLSLLLGLSLFGQNSAPTDIILSNTSIQENSSLNSIIGTFSSVDVDPDLHTYTFEVSGVDNASFNIVGSNLELNTALDFETKTNYNISITTDDGNGGTFDKAFVITVSNENETPIYNDTSFTIAENSINGTSIGTRIASDVDAGTVFSYNIIGGNTSSTFAINNSGQITVNNVNGLDLETNPIFNLTIQALDNGVPAKSDNASATINLTNVNDAPVINAGASQAIFENTSTAITAVSISDQDVGSDSLNITLKTSAGTYTLSSILGLRFLYGDGVNDDSTSIRGTLTNINSALSNFLYLSNLDFVGSDSLLINVTDNGSTGPGGVLTDSHKMDLTINPRNISYSAQPMSQTICEGDSLLLFVAYMGTNPITFQWQLNGIDIPGEINDSLSIDYTQLIEAGTYVCKTTNPAGTFNSNGAVITVRDKPVNGFTANEVCNGNTNSITNTSTIASGTIDWFVWDFADGGNLDSTNWNTNRNYSSDGIYNVSLITRSNFGCLDTAIEQVFSNPNPVAYFQLADICFVDSLIPNNLTTINSGTVSYVWDWGDSNSDTGFMPSYFYTSTDVYTVQMTATSNKGCVRTHDTVLTINPSPTANFIAPNSCDSTDVLFEEVSSISTGTLTNQWILGDGTILNNISDPTHLFNGSGDYQNKLIVTSDKNCVDSITKTITIFEKPNLGETITHVKCFGQNSGAISLNTTTGKQPYFYSINGGNWQFENLFQGLNKNTHEVTVLDNNNCQTVRNLIIEEPDLLEEGNTEITKVKCSGESSGEIEFNPKGGTAPYFYYVNITDEDPIFSKTSLFSSNKLNNLIAKRYPTFIFDSNGCNVEFIPNVTQPSKLAISKTFVPVNCKNDTNGQITVNASGSNGMYSYSLDSGKTYQNSGIYTDLIAGNYLVTVKDSANCSISEGLTLDGPQDSIKLSINEIRNIKCYGLETGKVTLDVVGGTGVKTFGIIDSNLTQFDFTFNNLPADTFYFSVVDEKGCKDSIEVEVMQPLKPTVLSWNELDVNCFNASTGSINMNATGGTAPYLYSLNGSLLDTSGKFNNLKAGKHYAKLLDWNNCEILDSIKILQPQKITYSGLSHVDETCEGDSTASINITPDGGVGQLLISINDGPSSTNGIFSNLVSNDYNISITDDNLCTWDTTIVINSVYSLPIAKFEFVNAEEAVIFTNQSINAASYEWDFGDSTTATSANPTHLYEDKLNYLVWMTATNNCGSTQDSAWINLNQIGINNINENEILLYPNPTKGQLTIKNISNESLINSIISILNFEGKLIYESNISVLENQNINIDVSNLTNGTYWIQLKTQTGLFNTKFIKNK